MNEKLRHARRYVETLLAAVLLAAAVLKALQLADGSSRAIIASAHALVLVAVIQAELLLSIWLLVGGASQPRFRCAVACFSLFALVASYEALHAMPSCGCFGNIKVPPLITASFDISAVAALWLTRPQRTAAAKSPISRHGLALGVVVAFFSVLLWTGYALRVKAAMTANPNGDLVILQPTNWIGKQFPLFDSIGRADELRSGRWLVVLYHHDCESCQQAIPEYRVVAEKADGINQVRVAFIAMPPFAAPGEDPVPTSAAYLHLSLRPDHDWFATTPVVAALQDGQVIFAAEGERAIHPPVNAAWK
jgi:hypothetical protein